MNYSNYFSSYQATEPPPIWSDTYILEQDRGLITQNYSDLLTDMIQALSETEKPLEDLTVLKNPFTFEMITDENEEEPENDLLETTKGIVDLARSFVGGTYVWGGQNPDTRQFDCSGLIQYVFKLFGYNLPRSSTDMRTSGKSVKLDEVVPGDIICTTGSPSHVKMVSKIEDGQVYTIEAKGKKWGIVETPLKYTDNIVTIRRIVEPKNTMGVDSGPKPTYNSMSVSGRFSDPKEFYIALNSSYKKALARKGLDPEYSKVLTAVAALESAKGKSLAANFNYGGVKVTNGLIRAGVPYKSSLTTDYIDGRKVRHYLNFRAYSSIDDYCDKKLDLLLNSRYRGGWKYSAKLPFQFWEHMLRAGYCNWNIGGYIKYVKQLYNEMTKLGL